MEKNIKKGAVAFNTNLEIKAKATQDLVTFPKVIKTPVHNKVEIINNDSLIKKLLTTTTRKAMPVLYQEVPSESPVVEIEIHWMAFAVYNQK